MTAERNNTFDSPPQQVQRAINEIPQAPARVRTRSRMPGVVRVSILNHPLNRITDGTLVLPTREQQ